MIFCSSSTTFAYVKQTDEETDTYTDRHTSRYIGEQTRIRK